MSVELQEGQTTITRATFIVYFSTSNNICRWFYKLSCNRLEEFEVKLKYICDNLMKL